MKNLYLLFSFALMSIFAFGQTPQAFKYQAVARDLNGNPVINQEISVKISILSGSPEGTVEYCEIHQTTTNNLGLINLEVGRGTAVTGNFALIAWGSNASFIKTEMDLTGGDNFVFMGTSQLLSVPFSLFSDNGIRSMTTEERDAIINPTIGMQIYNINTNCLNYFNGTNWFETCGTCTPQPSNAFAGNDLYFTSDTTATYLQGNTPESGIGTWSLINGTGGIFEDINDPATIFTGLSCTSYELMWTISTACNSKNDLVNVEFDAIPTNAFAGEDLTITTDLLSINLTANSPEVGNGYWTIIDGEGGIIENELNPVSLFTGQPCKTYELVWSIITECYTSSDTVKISFFSTPTEANAGSDQLGLTGTWTTLSANAPQNGTGQWTILSGTGGIINSPTSPTSIFLGQNLQQYLLEWRITNTCDTVSDNVLIAFGFVPFLTCGDTLFDTRDSKKYATVQIGEQCWMAENLNTGIRIDSTIFPIDDGIIEKYCYRDDPINCDIYGGLYKITEMLNYNYYDYSDGICPEGWTIPSFDDNSKLVNFFGGISIAGGKLKQSGTLENGTGLWKSPNSGATNESGFNALPSGAGMNSHYLNERTFFISQMNLIPIGGIVEINALVLQYNESTALLENWSGVNSDIPVRCIKKSTSFKNYLPNKPENPYPTNNSDLSTQQVTLTWDECIDPNNDTISYDVYLNEAGSTLLKIADNISDNQLFVDGLVAGKQYLWNVCASDNKSYGVCSYNWIFNVVESTIWTCGNSLVDERDGKSYNTVQIGEQCWMAENLNIGMRIDGAQNQTDDEVFEKYCYDNLDSNCDVYGGLYQWDEMMDYTIIEGSQGICPTGWHLPTDAEWCTITTYLDATVNCSTYGCSGISVSGKMKSTGTIEEGTGLWYSPNIGATNSSGFTGLPSGYRDSDGYFYYLGYSAKLWSSTEKYGVAAWYRYLFYGGSYVCSDYDYKVNGFSVRCVKDN